MEADRSQKDMATYVIEVAELNSEVSRNLQGCLRLFGGRLIKFAI